MSAITNTSSQFLTSTHVYRTKVKLVIHSHAEAPPQVLSQEIVSFSIRKPIKGVGTAAVTFVPNKNYLNKIFPNDYANIYIDRGDGEGWVRTFFGFVDRIQENYSVNQNGAPNTSYSITCSDLTKAFDKTQIYFNPHIDATRKDFDGSWIGAVNVGGVALQTKGVAVTGSPPDVLLNNIFVMLGASSQLILPSGYVPRTKDKFRQQRAEFIIGRLKSNILASLPQGASIAQYLEYAEKAIAAKAPFSSGFLVPADASPEARQLAKEAAYRLAHEYRDAATDELFQLKAVLGTAEPSVRPSFLDILDVFTFCERGAIDGYTADLTYWQKEGSLLGLLQQMSNELVNEMFFDLRPMIDASEQALAAGSNWSRTPDEIGQNISTGKEESGYGAVPPGVRYVPALVYREYPFSTVDYLDATSLKLSINGSNGEQFSVGKIQFGAIFSDAPNQKGRHVIDVPNINIEDNSAGAGTAGMTQKHIDVAVIKPTEIISSSFGRSDAEHYNLTSIYSDAVLGESARYFMHDIVPITNAVGITRHGLRVRDLTTNFARFADHSVPKVTADKAKEIEEKSDETSTPPPTTPNAVVLPIAAGSFTATSRYGWRDRPAELANPPGWRWHHGIDLRAALDTPVMAVADGVVVAVVPAWPLPKFGGYGNFLIIKHDQKYQGTTIYSVYAHLNRFNDTVITGNPDRIKEVRHACAKDLFPQGRMAPFRVSAGQVIAYVGNTTRADDKGNPFTAAGSSHVHFEIIRGYPSKKTDRGVPAFIAHGDNKQAKPADPTPEVAAQMNSFDPAVWFQSHGIDISHPEEFDPEADDKATEDSDTALHPEADKDDRVHPANVNAATIDNGRIRSQIARWALLDDHWYQHNIEYLSGTITMRGAPGIRVGYRLDIDDPQRPLSFYVEEVEHSWEYPGAMTTTLTVTRGQPNKPFPVYVLPYFKGFKEVDVQRKEDSRLGKFFTVNATSTTRKGTFYSSNGPQAHEGEPVNPDDTLTNSQFTSGEMYIPQGAALDLADVQTKTINETVSTSTSNESKVVP